VDHVRSGIDAGCVIGIDLGGTKCHGILADLEGEVLLEELHPTDEAGSPEGTLATMIRVLWRGAERLGRRVEALGLGVPAIVDPVSGLAVGGPNVHWDGFPIVERLRAMADVPVAVENDLNLAALGHSWRGDARGRASVVVLGIGTGIGGAVVLDGQVVRGRHGAGGEVGYLVLRRDQLEEPVGSGLGAFERIAAGPAIAGAAGARFGGEWTTEAVFSAARAGDAAADELLREMADLVAMAIIAMATTVDPEVVILDGSVGRAFAPYAGWIRSRVASQLPFPPEVIVSSMEGNATTMGAVVTALRLVGGRKAPGAGGESLGGG
jgi:glucokinase